MPPPAPSPARSGTRSDVWLASLVRAAHPAQAVGTALALALAAALTGRPLAEVGLVGATVLVGQSVAGWADDLADRERDARQDPRKPLVRGTLEPGSLAFATLVAVLLLVPLAISAGPTAGTAYLVSVAVAVVGDRLLHARVLSFVPWAASFALLPVYLSHGGWGGQGTGQSPSPAMVALAALLGVCVHVLLALPGTAADHQEGERSLPLRLAQWLGATRAGWLAAGASALVVVALLYVGRADGLG